MTVDFEELDYRRTALGELVLRRRAEPRLAGREVYEVKLGDEFLMSSLFTESEVALARLGLAELEGAGKDVVVGGLGLGFTAAAVLDSPAVRSLIVIEALGPVIEWHRRGLVPLGERLCSDARCRLVNGDFFALAASPEEGFDPASPGRRVDAVLVDIDHSPRHLLAEESAPLYESAGLRTLARHLRPGGVFGLWSNDPPDDEFLETLGGVFPSTRAHVVSFPNPYTGSESACTVYVSRGATGAE